MVLTTIGVASLIVRIFVVSHIARCRVGVAVYFNFAVITIVRFLNYETVVANCQSIDIITVINIYSSSCTGRKCNGLIEASVLTYQ